jgi:prevent-host-death family protein
MARSIRKSRVKAVPLSQAKDALPRLLSEAAKGDIVITRRGRPVGVLIGFASDEDWFDYRLESDPGFPRRIERARKSAGR